MDWSRFDRERFRKIMAVALRAEGAEALTALERARAYLDGAGGSIDDVLGGTVTVQMHGAREGAESLKGQGHAAYQPPYPPTHQPSRADGSVNGGRQESASDSVNGQGSRNHDSRPQDPRPQEPRTQGSRPKNGQQGSDDPLRHAMYASRIVTQLRTENKRLNDLLDQATRYIADLESQVSQAQTRRPNGQDGADER